MTVGISDADTQSQVTSDGLYLLAGMDVTNKGEVVALEMDVEQGGFLDFKVLSIDDKKVTFYTSHVVDQVQGLSSVSLARRTRSGRKQ